jgi:hypothetical protein
MLAANTTTKCGRWYQVEEGDECGNVLSRYHISLRQFVLANRAVSEGDCTGSLVPGSTYCVGPTRDFQDQEPYIPDYYRYGCYAHDTAVANTSVLEYMKVMHVEQMALLPCLIYCLQEGKYVFGLENGDSCLCDHRLRFGSLRLDDAKCNVKCNGNSSDACGGNNAVEVYSLQETLPVQSQSIGCFASTEADPAVLGGGKSVKEVNSMSIQKCGSICSVSDYAFFALSEGSVCTCGDKLVQGAQAVDEEKCETDCSDGHGYFCGGKGFAEVYTTQPEKK